MVRRQHQLLYIPHHQLWLLLADRKNTLLRGACLPVRHVEDHALVDPAYSRMRRADKRGKIRRMPVITPGHRITFAHPLLDHGPLPFTGKNKIVGIQLKSVLDGRIVDLGAQLTATYQILSIEAGAFADIPDLFRRLPGKFPLASADINTQLTGMRIDRPLQGAHHGGRDSRTMPVHTHNSPQTLEPEWIAQTADDLRLAIVHYQRLRYGKTQLGHTIRQPLGNIAIM